MDPLVGLLVAGVLGAVVLYRTRRIAPDVPRGWRSSQSVAARLCRRLHRAVDAADASVGQARRRHVPVAQLEDAVGDLRACATAIDHQLVAAARLPLRPRHSTLLALRQRIAEVEKAAARVTRMAGDAGRPDVDGLRPSLQTVHERLDHLEAARQELRRQTG